MQTCHAPASSPEAFDFPLHVFFTVVLHYFIVKAKCSRMYRMCNLEEFLSFDRVANGNL